MSVDLTQVKRLLKSYFTTKDAQLIFVSTIAIVLVNGLVLLYVKYMDGNKDAERYYKHFEPIKYYILKFCYSIITISFAFNMRYLITNTLVMIKNKAITKMRSR